MDTEASLDNTDDEQLKQPIKTTIVLKIQQNIVLYFFYKIEKMIFLDLHFFVTLKLFSFCFLKRARLS